jgi:hypothetical protein
MRDRKAWHHHFVLPGYYYGEGVRRERLLLRRWNSKEKEVYYATS